MNLKDYQPQIKELILLHSDPDFNSLFDKILFGESNSDKFLVKMELNRLTTPCQRIIDFRDKTLDECILFELDNIEHHLTEEAIKVLQESIEVYGSYTIGVFEDVHFYLTQFKEDKNKKSLQKSKLKFDNHCRYVELSPKKKRANPRMFFVSKIEIKLPDGQFYKGHTSNISSGGIKIRVKNNISVNNQDTISVLFSELRSKSYEQVLDNRIIYEVVNQSIENENFFIYLAYADKREKFIDFISTFIQENNYKYKIDAAYYYHIAQTDMLKNLYLAQMNSLPIYLDSRSTSPFLFSLKNDNNQSILNSWDCEGVNQLPYLFSEQRLIKLLAYARPEGFTTIYSFIYSNNGKDYFLSATEDELLKTGLKELFIRYGSSKSSWNAYHLTITSYHYKKTRKPGTLIKKVPDEFLSITHVATLQKLIVNQDHLNTNSTETKNLNDIKQFIHRPNNNADSVFYELFSSEQRTEERYLYKSKLSLSINNVDFKAELVDFSESGLQVKLDYKLSIPLSSLVKIDLVELQKVSKKFPLTNLSYKVVFIKDKQTLHLQVADHATYNVCSQFFSLLVQKNSSSFKCIELKHTKQPANELLVKVAENAFVGAIFFVGKEANKPKIQLSAVAEFDQSLFTLFSIQSHKNDELNYQPIINNNLYERLIVAPYKNLINGKIYHEAFIYVEAHKNRDNNWVINSYIDDDFASLEEKKSFIAQSNENSILYALFYRISSLNPITEEVMQEELKKIPSTSTYLQKSLEDDLFSLDAMIEIVNITSDVLNAI